MRAVKRSMALAGLVLLFTAGPAHGQSARKPISSPEPTFPDLAKKMHLTGVVKVTLTIAPDGRVKNIEFHGGHPVLIEAVQRALKQWKYAPTGSESTVLLEFKF